MKHKLGGTLLLTDALFRDKQCAHSQFSWVELQFHMFNFKQVIFNSLFSHDFYNLSL